MPTPTDPDPSTSRALIPAAEQRLIPRPRALPITRKVALGVAAGAAGTFFAKRLVELVAEDAYRGLKHFITRRRAPQPSSAPVPVTTAPSPVTLPPASEPQKLPASSVIMRIVHIRQIVWLRTTPHDSDL